MGVAWYGGDGMWHRMAVCARRRLVSDRWKNPQMTATPNSATAQPRRHHHEKKAVIAHHQRY